MLDTMAHLGNTRTIYIFLLFHANENVVIVYPSKMKCLALFPQVKIFSVFVSASKNSVNCGNKELKHV